MGPMPYMRSVVDRNVVLRRIPACTHCSVPKHAVTDYTKEDELLMSITSVLLWTARRYAAIMNVTYYRGLQVLRKCRNNFQILGARRAVWSKFHGRGPTSLEWSVNLTFYGAFCTVPVNCYAFRYVRGERKWSNYGDNFRFPLAVFSHMGGRVLGILCIPHVLHLFVYSERTLQTQWSINDAPVCRNKYECFVISLSSKELGSQQLPVNK